MITPFPLSKILSEHEFVPQALIGRPIWDLAKRFGAEVEEGSDNFDNYQGAGAVFDDNIPFVVMHYVGHPKDTSTIYLQFDINDVHRISTIISAIISELKVPVEAVKWQRENGVSWSDTEVALTPKAKIGHASQRIARKNMNNLPTPKKGAAEVAKLTTSIAAAVAGIFFPGAGVLGPIASFAIEKWVKRPERLLLEELKRGNLAVLSDEKAATFIPMAYRFFETAKEGEYEHNLRLLAEFLKSELETEEPDPSSFARMSRRVEGLSLNELKVIALIDASLSKISKSSTNAPAQSERPFVSAHQLANDPSNRHKFDHFFLQEALSELAARGLLIADGASRSSKHEEYYFASASFMELIEKARSTVKESTTA
jgi:hypothetical protein